MTLLEFLKTRITEEKRPGMELLNQLKDHELRRVALLYRDHPDYQPEWREQ